MCCTIISAHSQNVNAELRLYDFCSSFMPTDLIVLILGTGKIFGIMSESELWHSSAWKFQPTVKS